MSVLLTRSAEPTWVQLIEHGRLIAVGDGDRLDLIHHPEMDTDNSVVYEELTEFFELTGLERVLRVPVRDLAIDYSSELVDVFSEPRWANAIREVWVHPRFFDLPPAQWPRTREFRKA
ncbi:hypothetical protein [Mycobacterium sp. D16Q16]|uniref:hypothetical protein n=1 Tax=Mycobacterium sp. D16Q16 TaxID=1855659 RepID=UPI0009922EE7|nr:hypothetical protein [Mycobacterium sp. D16Q16]